MAYEDDYEDEGENGAYADVTDIPDDLEPLEDTSIPQTAQYTAGASIPDDLVPVGQGQPQPTQQAIPDDLVPLEQAQPQAEGTWTGRLREAAHAVLPTAAAYPGIVTGAALGASVGSAVPVIGTTIGGVAGAILGGLGTSAAASYIQEEGLKLLGKSDAQIRAANAALDPVGTWAAGAVPQLLLGRPGAAMSLAQRGAGAVLGGGTEAIMQKTQGRELNPWEIAGSAALGGTLQPYRWVDRGIAAAMRPRAEPGAAPEYKPTIDPNAPRPGELPLEGGTVRTPYQTELPLERPAPSTPSRQGELLQRTDLFGGEGEKPYPSGRPDQTSDSVTEKLQAQTPQEQSSPNKVARGASESVTPVPERKQAAEQPVAPTKGTPDVRDQPPGADKEQYSKRRKGLETADAVVDRKVAEALGQGTAEGTVAPARPGLTPQQQAHFEAAKAAAPNLPDERLEGIAKLAGGPKAAALMAQNAAKRMTPAPAAGPAAAGEPAARAGGRPLQPQPAPAAPVERGPTQQQQVQPDATAPRQAALPLPEPATRLAPANVGEVLRARAAGEIPHDPAVLRQQAAILREANAPLARQYELTAQAIEKMQAGPARAAPGEPARAAPGEPARPAFQQAQQQQPPARDPFAGHEAAMRARERLAAAPRAAARPAGETAAPLDVKPATASDLQSGLLASLRRAVMPMWSESARLAGKAVREAYGPLARMKEQAQARFTNDLHKVANSLDRPGFEKFVDAYESGKTSTLPKEQQAVAEALKKNYDSFWKEIEKLPHREKVDAIKDYLTHMYKNDRGQVDGFVRNWYGASGGSLQKRVHPTYADARAKGLEPLSNNPIEHFARYAEGMSHYIAQQRVINALDADGRIWRGKPEIVGASGTPEPRVKNEPPPGYAELNMPGSMRNGQRAYAPRDIAESLNQFYAKGLRGGQFKDIYEFAQYAKNSWTAVELGLSAYHFTTMQVEAMATGMARAMQIAATGDFGRATKELLKSPLEGWTSYRYGREMRQVYRGLKTGTAVQERLMQAFEKANIQPGNLAATREYDMSKLGNLWDAKKRGSLPNEIDNMLKEIKDSYGLKAPGHAIDMTRRAMQTLSKPLFEHYIPELKLGAMMKDLESWLHANPKATDEQLAHAARKISDSIDNRMGEMVGDNLFMNKTIKDAGYLTLRSFAFTVGGPFREIMGGFGALGRGALQGKNVLSPTSEHFDPRTAYALAFVPTIAAISAIYQFLRTGEGPSDPRDIVTPKTGGTVKSVGQQVPERILVPGYHKDFLGYFVNPQGPLHELEAKLAAPWSALKEQVTGKDWRGKDIVPPRASALEWLGAHAGALGKRLTPISQQQLFEGTKKGSALTLPEQMLGVRTPGAYILNPKGLEAYMTKKAQQDWRAGERQESRQRQERGLPPLPQRQLPR